MKKTSIKNLDIIYKMGLFKSKNFSERYILEGYSLKGRREKQEDSVLIMQGPIGDVLGLVADGVGGEPHGDFASKIVKEVFENTFAQMQKFDSIESYIRKTIFVAGTMIMQKSLLEPEYRNSATTVSGFIITNQYEIYIFNVGDSRVYLFRKGELKQLTKDHNLAQELQDLNLTKQQYSELYKHQLTNYISSNISKINIDIEKKQYFLVDDIVFASTDGLHGYLSHKEIENFIKKNRNKNLLAKKLCNWAYEKGSQDNIGVVICKRLI